MAIALEAAELRIEVERFEGGALVSKVATTWRFSVVGGDLDARLVDVERLATSNGTWRRRKIFSASPMPRRPRTIATFAQAPEADAVFRDFSSAVPKT